MPAAYQGSYPLACFPANSAMNTASFCTPSRGMLLYMEARMPPTERWPFSWTCTIW